MRNVEDLIAPKLIGRDVTEQREIDELMIELDGTENKANLGGNATLSVSLAVADAASKALGIPPYRHLGGEGDRILPVPWVWLQAIEVTGRRRTLPFQEHHIVPVCADSFSEALRMSAEVNFEANKIMAKRYGASRVFDGVTYFPAIVDEREALDRLMEAVENVGYKDVFMISMDCAASHRYDRDEERYVIGKKVMVKDEMINFYKDLVDDYPIFSLEDPLHQDDFEGHAELTKELGIQIVGDDLFVTSMTRLRKGMDTKAANALLLKPNQIGTLTETLDTARFTMRNGLRVVVSGRQGIDEEDLIPDITVALNAGQVKIGPLSSRRAKYNRLLRMEEELGEGGRYPSRETLIS